jgi:hypothetical protein
MVLTLDISNLPYQMIDGVKYFELIAGLVQRELLPGLFINGWGYNGRHILGHQFFVTATDGNDFPANARMQKNTMNIIFTRGWKNGQLRSNGSGRYS